VLIVNFWIGGMPVAIVGAVEAVVMWTSTMIISMILSLCLLDFVMGGFGLVQC
jgi:hypothetical protein